MVQAPKNAAPTFFQSLPASAHLPILAIEQHRTHRLQSSVDFVSQNPLSAGSLPKLRSPPPLCSGPGRVGPENFQAFNTKIYLGAWFGIAYLSASLMTLDSETVCWPGCQGVSLPVFPCHQRNLPRSTCCSGAKAAFTATLAQATSSLVRLDQGWKAPQGICKEWIPVMYACIYKDAYTYIHTANIVYSIHMHLNVSSTVYSIDTNRIVMKLEQ